MQNGPLQKAAPTNANDRRLWGRRSGGEVLRQDAERKNCAGAASLRGQGTPAYPARLRSERARNSRILVAAG